MASYAGDAASEAAVAVAVAGDDSRSRRAVRWAAEHLVPHAHRVVLVHVIPAITSIPSPSGERVPVGRIGRDLVEMYVQDQKSKAQQVFFPFRGLCGTRNVETVVVEGENPAAALLKYVSDSGTKNLVLGSSSNWFRRVIKGPDVSTTLLKFSQISCNLFVVSHSKLIMKFVNQSVSKDPISTTGILTVSQKAFDQRRLGVQKSPVSDANSKTFLCGRDHEEGELVTYRRKPDFLACFKDTSSDKSSTEVINLKKLQNALAMYIQVCDDLVHTKKKVQLLYAECSQAENKLKEVKEAKQMVSPETVETIDSYFVKSNWRRRYSKYEIEVATDNFSEDKKIGEGSYGNVYKCNLDHTPVAIKVVLHDAWHKKEQFMREVEILSQLHHPHLVLLLGDCPENGCLVYEFMEKGSLEDQLFSKNSKRPLPWIIRFRILYEVACGLAFLHSNKPEPIVHRDLKPGNILLDKNYVSKIGDVGLAKLLSDVVPDGLTEYRETVLAGTFYYMDPEYQRTGTIRPKSDLYAWGVIALQLLTGKHPNGLIVSVENAIKEGNFSDVLDKSIRDWPLAEAERLAELALECSRLRCRDRPNLDSEILPELEEILNKAHTYFKLRQHNKDVPKHYICPILKVKNSN
ncbi:U-box domain-containing protein 34 isoform X2 [Canna indica]|uniref:RING-type E3 ubiquitin transferase n=1 Tax=Canna indica TaxID=4628 RepID=A0AAQ3KHW9_9LILI|nr:U-box domain-containing protein 34 isoform X2 [Canna indica]